MDSTVKKIILFSSKYSNAALECERAVMAINNGIFSIVRLDHPNVRRRVLSNRSFQIKVVPSALVIYLDESGVETGATLVGLDNIKAWLADHYTVNTLGPDLLGPESGLGGDGTGTGTGITRSIIEPPVENRPGNQVPPTKANYNAQTKLLFSETTPFSRPPECSIEGRFGDECTVPPNAGLLRSGPNTGPILSGTGTLLSGATGTNLEDSLSAIETDTGTILDDPSAAHDWTTEN